MWETFFKEAVRMGNIWLSLPVICAAICLRLEGKSGRDPVSGLVRVYYEGDDDDDEPYYSLGMSDSKWGVCISTGNLDSRWVYNNYPYFKKSRSIAGEDVWSNVRVGDRVPNWSIIDSSMPHMYGMLFPYAIRTVREQYDYAKGAGKI